MIQIKVKPNEKKILYKLILSNLFPKLTKQRTVLLSDP